jgi:hypothetical protein
VRVRAREGGEVSVEWLDELVVRLELSPATGEAGGTTGVS